MNTLPLYLRPDAPQASDETFLKLIANLEKEDLSSVREKLGSRYGYTPRKQKDAQLAFLRFISITATRGGGIAPLPLADRFWHEFILHTVDYSEFCMRHFGEFIHHQPLRGSRELGCLPLRESIRILGEYYGNVEFLLDYYKLR